MKVLVTSGATQEPIDGVRFLTNFSTGATGAAIADWFAARGDLVTYLSGRGARLPEAPCELWGFGDFASLDQRLRELLAEREYGLIIHLAAVSDYSVDRIVLAGGRERVAGDQGKLASEDSEDLILKLRRNFKIVERLKNYARAGRRPNTPTVVAFKLTHTPSADERERAVARLAGCPDVDFVVHNDLGELREGGPRRFTLYCGDKAIGACTGVPNLASALSGLLSGSAS